MRTRGAWSWRARATLPLLQAVALDADGNIVWQRDYTGLYLGIPSGIAPSAAGGFGHRGLGRSGGRNAARDRRHGRDAVGEGLRGSVHGQRRPSRASSGLPTAGSSRPDGTSSSPTTGSWSSRWTTMETSSAASTSRLPSPSPETTPSLTVTAVTSSVDDETANTAVADVDVTYIDTDVARARPLLGRPCRRHSTRRPSSSTPPATASPIRASSSPSSRRGPTSVFRRRRSRARPPPSRTRTVSTRGLRIRSPTTARSPRSRRPTAARRRAIATPCSFSARRARRSTGTRTPTKR